MYDLNLTAEQLEFRETLRDFVAGEVKPAALHPDRLQPFDKPLLVDVLKDGKLVYEFPSIEAIRERRKADLARLDAGVLRIVNPHIYHVSLTTKLWTLKQDMIHAAR